jgi:uncharacterized protein YdhG (YjbR/CyaY superfamily)
MNQPQTIETYIAEFPVETQERLRAIQEVIWAVVPDGEEAIRYGMPTCRYKGKNLIHFAAFKNHIGLYPLPETVRHFEVDLASYPTAKGSIQFPHSDPLPLQLISNIVKFRLEQIQRGEMIEV